MSIAAPGHGNLERAKASLFIFLSLAGVACGLTLMFLAMRSVMEIGGACAEGGPFVPVRPCPDGVPGLLLGGLWGGVACFGIYLWQAFKHKVPTFAGFAWPALFLSLGWNFLEFGLNPPGSDGLAWGWLLCAVVFALMGGLPLLVVVGPTWRRFAGRDTDNPLAGTPLAGIKSVGTLVKNARPARARPAPAPPTPTAPEGEAEGDFVGQLERLDRLRRSGALDADEFESAKERLLGGRRG